MIRMIAAMDQNRGIGFKNKLLYNSKTDMDNFKEKTMMSTIVMGYNTMLSLPRFPLPNRLNIVHTEEEVSDEVYEDRIFLSKKDILDLSEEGDIWVIGGEKTYEEFLDHADEIHLTIFKGQREGDTYFPAFELFFEEVSSEHFIDENAEGTMIVYKRIP